MNSDKSSICNGYGSMENYVTY